MLEINIPVVPSHLKLPSCAAPYYWPLRQRHFKFVSALSEVFKKHEPFDETFHLRVDVYCQPRAGVSKKRTAAMLAGDVAYEGRLNADKVLEQVTLAGLPWDGLFEGKLSSALVQLRYGEEARTVVRIYPLPGRQAGVA